MLKHLTPTRDEQLWFDHVPRFALLVDTTDVVATCTGLTRTLSSSESFSSRFRCRRLTRGDWHAGVKATSIDTHLHHADFNRQSVIHFVVRFNWKCEKIRANARAVGSMRTTGNANAALSMNARVVVCQTHDSTTMQSRWRCSTSCALSCPRRPRSECLFFRVQCLTAKSRHGRPCYQHCNTNPKSPSASGVLDGVQQKKTVNQAVGFCSYTNIKANAIRGETYDKIDRVGLALGVSSALFAKTTRLFDCTQGRKNESVSIASSLAFQTPADEQHAVKTDVFAINMLISFTIHFCVSPFLSLALACALYCRSSLQLIPSSVFGLFDSSSSTILLSLFCLFCFCLIETTSSSTYLDSSEVFSQRPELSPSLTSHVESPS